MKKTILLFSLILSVIVSTTSNSNAQRKMSSQAKGALIGGAGGAVAGGLIGHGVKGALIGGAIGAGGGYIIGNEHRRNNIKRQRAYRRTRTTHYYSSRRRY
jgi:uncharacterized protein YcfJ